jgi:hypothetical protein
MTMEYLPYIYTLKKDIIFMVIRMAKVPENRLSLQVKVPQI